MARQPQLEDVTSSRMQSAPINIAYGNQETQRFWRDNYHRWNNHHNQFDNDDEEQNHHEDEDQMVMMQNGFSGGIIDACEDIEPTISVSSQDDKENEVVAAPAANTQKTEGEQTNEVTTHQKIGEMSDDLFEQLLAENERKLRQLISYVERSSCTQLSHLSFF